MSGPFTFLTYLDRGDEEIAITVSYTVSRYYAATMEQPEEGGEIDIQSVTVAGQPFATTEAEDDYLTKQASERASDDMADEAATAAEYRYETRRDARDAQECGL